MSSRSRAPAASRCCSSRATIRPTSLDRIDGLLLTGGADVDPAEYGERAHPSVHVDAARDAFEIPLTRAALARAMPLFAICRGVQVLNVAAGGTLVQDIPSVLASGLNHSVEVPKDAVAASYRRPSRQPARAVMVGAKADSSCAVNSRHHQSVSGCGRVVCRLGRSPRRRHRGNRAAGCPLLSRRPMAPRELLAKR